MSDWQVGDLAVCINDSPCHCGRHIPELTKGAILRVSDVLSHPREGVGLCFEEISSGAQHSAFGARRFRKIHPDEREACEPEFVTLLQRIKRREAA